MTKDVTNVRGIGEKIAALLAKKEIRTVKKLANVSLAELLSIPGFGKARAAAVQEAAVSLLPIGKKKNKKSKKTKNIKNPSKKKKNKKKKK